MLRRVGASYLWVGPIVFIPLGALYHAVSFSAGLAGGVVHLAVTAAGLHAAGAFQRAKDESSSILGVMLLIMGGAEVWATGPSGPPMPTNLPLAVFNNAGLTLGFFLTLLGLAALTPTLASTRTRAVGAVALTSFTVMFILWVVESAAGFALYSTPFIAMPLARSPDWFQVLQSLNARLIVAIYGGGYLAGAVVAEIATRASWVGRRAGRLMVLYAAIGAVGSGPLRVLLIPSGITSLSQLPASAWWVMPFLPPAMMCLVPYYVGVSSLAHWARSQQSTVAGHAASFSRSL